VTVSDRPTPRELVQAVREYLQQEVVPGTEGRLSFFGRVAANVLGQIERELELGPELSAKHAARLEGLGVADDAVLAAAIRAGDFDTRYDELAAALRDAVADKLAIANPGYITR
jgi:hypothetical protein